MVTFLIILYRYILGGKGLLLPSSLCVKVFVFEEGRILFRLLRSPTLFLKLFPFIPVEESPAPVQVHGRVV